MKYLVLIFALLIAACVPIQSDGESEAALKEQEQVEVVNVADWGLIEVSDGAWNKHFAGSVDGDSDTWWAADDFAPQWLEIDLEDVYLVERVEFSVSQVRPGPGKHEIVLVDGGGEITNRRQFSATMGEERISDGDLFTLEVDPPQQVTRVRILTIQHEGWVAIRELRIFAQIPLSNMSPRMWIRGLAQPVFLTARRGRKRASVRARKGGPYSDNQGWRPPGQTIPGHFTGVGERGTST